MTRTEFDNRVKKALYQARGISHEEIDAEIEKERKWLNDFYERAVRSGDFNHELRNAVANFSLWV